ncbi:dipeptidyl peptidase 2 [Aplysia californica]|uniref:Dipeptidyl peptidase 2 n=1 Tax=Aplysia californica TaxID=6500 RepID=A0ABM0K3S1_APLCA|nr:dipeptidyl peptidase 2 [Aplysia californica]
MAGAGVFSVLLSSILVLACADFPYQVGYFNQYVDHFNQMSYGESTYKQKYLFQDKNWKRGKGPIFFYAGNEGPIEGFWTASGFVHQIAPEFEAYVVFPEHRFYGESLPMGNKSFESPYLGLLTVDQAMADYARFLSELKKSLNCTECRVIAFGGRAAYMRFKYPNIVHGSLAASAPILMQDPAGPHDFFFSHVTNDFKGYSEKCYLDIRAAFREMDVLFAQGQSGLDKISNDFFLCNKLTDKQSYQHLQGWVRNAFTFMAMLDYPYATSFMGGLPGHPVKVGCNKIMSAKSLLSGLADAAGVYYNVSATVKCYDIMAEFVECADPTGCGNGPAAKAWDYQACTDIILPTGSNNVTDMFPVLPWNLELRKDYCKKTFGITPRVDWPATEFLGSKISSSSNIIFSNGDLDPWMGGGVLQNVSPTVISILVKGGAHHLDLRASNPLDPPGVIAAREKERGIIRGWLNQS